MRLALAWLSTSKREPQLNFEWPVSCENLSHYAGFFIFCKEAILPGMDQWNI
jgi:hypothetical protein